MLYTLYIVDVQEEHRKLAAVRIKPSAMRTAKIAAAVAGKTMGKWIEEAIQEKAEKENN